MKSAYKAGWRKAINWDRWWTPGGPYYCDDESREGNEEWKRGFKEGLKSVKK